MAKLNAPSPQYHRYYVYDEAGRLLGEYRPSGSRVTEYVWLDDQLIAVFSTYDGGYYQYVLTDHLATPRAVVHPVSNAILWRWDLTGSAFGDHAVQNDPDGDGLAFTLNLRYPGQYYDGETGLHYNYFRDYDPGTGRYVQSDPVGLLAGPSTYQYAFGSSLMYYDPYGLRNWTKNVVSLLNYANAGKLYVQGALRIGSGIGMDLTGLGAAPGAGMVAWGTWNMASAEKAAARGRQQWLEAACEDSSDYSAGDHVKTFAGVLPWGTDADDPDEPFWMDVAGKEIEQAAEDPTSFLLELGTLSP